MMANRNDESEVTANSMTTTSTPAIHDAHSQVIPSLLSDVKEPVAEQSSDYRLVDTAAKMISFLDCISDIPTASAEPSLYIDLEGVNLSRQGSICIIQIMVLHSYNVYLVDILKLGSDAFTISCGKGTSLRQVLESDGIIKAFFDVRNDSDALHHHYGVRLEGVYDIQLIELVTRPARVSRKYLTSLAKCVEYNAGLAGAEMTFWKQMKDKGLRLFCPAHGGSYEIFNTRPLAPDILEYCVQDVVLLPRLWQSYDQKLSKILRSRVLDATKRRIQESQSPAYIPHGRHKALAPTV